MSKYDDLRMGVTRFVTAENNYWQKLYAVYQNNQLKLREYLGLQNEVVTDAAGDHLPVVQTGLLNKVSNKFDSIPPWSLPKENEKLCYDILIRLCTSESDELEILRISHVKVSRSGDEYYFELNDLPTVITCFEIDGSVDMTPFFESWHSDNIRAIAPRKS